MGSSPSTFDKVGKKVTWQKLAEGFADHVFRFQVLDEASPTAATGRTSSATSSPPAIDLCLHG